MFVYRCDHCGLASEEHPKYQGKVIAGVGTCSGCGGRKMRLFEDTRKTIESARVERLYSFLILGLGFVLGAFSSALFMAIK